MKKILYILLSISVIVVSCKEDTLDNYNGDNYVHFTPTINDVAEFSFNFALDTKTTRETEAVVPIEIRLWGYLPTKDFKCYMNVSDKSTAKPSDYENPESATFRTGHHVDTLWVKVKRNEKMLATDYKLVIDMDRTDDDHVVAPAKYCTVTVNVTDNFPSEPMWWGTTQDFGAYSPIKYRLLNLYLGKVLTNLNEYTNITLREEAQRFKDWWMTNWDKYTYYDEDGTTPLYETILR